MATTLKKLISPDSPKGEEQCAAHKISILQNFSKTFTIHNILLQTIIQTAPTLLTLGVTVLNTINTHEFQPSIISGAKFKIPPQYFVVNFGDYKSLSSCIYFLHACARTAVQIVSFKNPPTNYCCFGTS